jgi:nucleotide-binding universal stress UspA family protein
LSSSFKENAMFPIRAILHPTDFSEASQAAFQLACALARDHGAHLIVAHVLPDPVTVHDMERAIVDPAGYRAELRAKLPRLRPQDSQLPLEFRLLDGDPGGAILRLARDAGCDLIVMGTHGWTGLHRLVAGSVAEQVLRHATCPVVTVKAPPLATEAVRAMPATKEAEVVPAGTP